MPGPCAAVTAMTLCGLDTKRFMFYGFLSHKKQDKIKELKEIMNIPYTIVFYEAPHKLVSTLEAFKEVFGNRKIAILREMTKKFEEVLRLTVDEALDYYSDKEPKGEFVITVSGAEKKEDDSFSDMSIEDHVEYYINMGFDKKEAIKKCAEDRDVPKRDVYNLIMKK